jgi:hypothetical protein
MKKNIKTKTCMETFPFVFPKKTFEEDECSTSSSYVKTKSDQSFLKELSKIIPTFNLLQVNPIKNIQTSNFSQTVSPTGRFPYQRKARSISPPKDSLTVCERKNDFLFIAGSPVIPDNSLHGNFPCEDETEEDNDLKLLKQEYLKLIQEAPGLNFKSELFDSVDELSGTEEFDEWETSIMKKMQLH